MDRLWVKVLLYPTIAIMGFLFFLWMMLPVDRLKSIAESQLEAALGYEYNVSFTTFDISGVSAFEATDIEISSKPPPPNISEEEKKKFKRVTMAIDRLSVDLRLISTLTGTPAADYVVEMGGGTMEGSYEQVTYEPVEVKPAKRSRASRRSKRKTLSGKGDQQAPPAEDGAGGEDGAEGQDEGSKLAQGHQIDMTIAELPLNRIGLIQGLLGLPLNGTVSGDVSVLVGQRGELLESKTDVTIARTSISKGVLPFDTGMGQFELKNSVRFGDIVLKSHVEAGKLLIDSVTSSGPDVVIEANGNITLRQPFGASRAKINARIKPDPKFLTVNNLKVILDMNSKVRNAKAGDWYGILLSGPLNNLSPFPSSRTASGLEKGAKGSQAGKGRK